MNDVCEGLETNVWVPGASSKWSSSAKLNHEDVGVAGGAPGDGGGSKFKYVGAAVTIGGVTSGTERLRKRWGV